MKITDQLVQAFMEGEWDRTPLTRESFPVNMRLYKISQSYQKIILEIIKYMDEHLHSHFEDYADPRGIAAPNLGFPFKIIGYKKKPCENQFCLNPKITFYSPSTITTQSNCGSLLLKDPISIERHLLIDFEYYDLEGNLIFMRNVSRTDGSFTIQHEIDQIQGFTLIDRREKNKTKK